MTINKALPGGNPSIVISFYFHKKNKEEKQREKRKKTRKRKEKKKVGLVCSSFSGLDENTKKFGSTG